MKSIIQVQKFYKDVTESYLNCIKKNQIGNFFFNKNNEKNIYIKIQVKFKNKNYKKITYNEKLIHF